MNVYLLLDDSKATDRLSSVKEIETCEIIASIDDVSWEENALVVVSDKFIQPNELFDLRQKVNNIPIIYLISNGDDANKIRQTEALCHRYNIDFIAPYRTINQISEHIEKIYFNKNLERNNVVSFISSLPQQGLTSTLLSAASMISQMTKESKSKIVVVGLNAFNPGDSFFTYRGKYLDELWGYLHTEKASYEELYKSMHMISESSFYLAGTRDLKKLYYYNIEGVEYLIKFLKDNFDLILLDCGSYLDTPLAAQGLLSADMVIATITQQHQSKEGWFRQLDYLLEPIFNIKPEDMLLLVNKGLADPELESPKKLSESLGVPLVGSIPYQETMLLNDDKFPLQIGDAEYKESLESLARVLCRTYKLPVSETVEHNPSFWQKLMKSKKGGIQ